MKFYHPITHDLIETSDTPWLWVLLLGFFYFLYRGMWIHVIGSFLLAILTSGLSWVIYPFFAKAAVRNHYISKGYREWYANQRWSSGYDSML